MKPDTRFVFLADTQAATLTIRRTFASGRQLVWDCHTRHDLLDRWFAPKPLSTRTKSMDFRAGGHWHYAMIDPDGTEYWGWFDYLTIQPIDAYAAMDGFCDASGTLNPNLPRSRWDVSFADLGDKTQVQTIVRYASAQDLETVIAMGMEAGMTSTLARLDELLLTLNEEMKRT
jgi:uncharacterized protein YndB with AHSA1/START domain